MTHPLKRGAPPGFTLVELMIVIALIGILASIAVPMTKNYVNRAKYAGVNSILRHLMNGQDRYFFENGEFFPAGSSGKLTIKPGQSLDIPELGYKFSPNHSNRIIIQTINNTSEQKGKKKKKKKSEKVNRYDITIDTDFDANGNGLNDRYMITSDFRNDSPLISKGITYDRYLRQLW